MKSVKQYIKENDLELYSEGVSYIHGLLDGICKERNISISNIDGISFYPVSIIEELFNQPIN